MEALLSSKKSAMKHQYHTLFGRVLDGMEVVKALGFAGNSPVDPIDRIISITISQD